MGFVIFGVEHAKVYEAFYVALGKDYEAEALALASDVHARRRRRQHSSLLDVGCGTGEHLRHLQRWFTVEGVERSPAMAALAREKLPGVTVHEMAMCDLDLGRRFDVVTCLGSSIAYARTVEELEMIVSAMARHVAEGGVLAVEPGLFAGDWEAGIVGMRALELGQGTRAARMSATWLQSDLAMVDYHYLVGRPGDPIIHFSERHEFGLFTRDHYEAAFRRAGLSVKFTKPGLTDHGLFLAKPP